MHAFMPMCMCICMIEKSEGHHIFVGDLVVQGVNTIFSPFQNLPTRSIRANFLKLCKGEGTI